MKTQQERLLALLQQRGDAGVFVYELTTPRPDGLGISQYNARVLELRELGHNIESVEKGHFVLHQSKESKLEALREEYRQAKKKNEYGRMELIKARANVLKMKEDNFISDVRAALV